MADRIDYPPTLQGDELSQLRQLYNYLYQTAEILNGNLQAIGGNELSDEDLAVMRDVLRTPAEEAGPEDALAKASREAETLKSMIIKTAEFVRTAIDEYNIKLIGTTEAEGKLGKYVRHTGLDVAVTPEGITQNYTFAEIIQGLRVFEINAKNYIKTGYLRTVNSIPIYGVAIGKDIVTFSADGTETYNDGNKVAELTADALSFYQGGTLVAKYTGSRVSFYSNGDEVMYITGGKIYAVKDFCISSGADLNIESGGDLNIKSGGKLNVNSGGDAIIEGGGDLDINSSANLNVKSGGKLNVKSGGDLTVESGGDLLVNSGGNIKVNSGGTLDVNTNNFRLDSANRKMVSGNWTFDQYGIKADISGHALCLCASGRILYLALGQASAGAPETDAEMRLLIGQAVYRDQAISGEPMLDFGQGSFWGMIGDNHTPLQEVWTKYICFWGQKQQSSRALKEDISELGEMGSILDALVPVRYRYKVDPGKVRFGLIWEDTYPVLPEICAGDPNGEDDRKGIDYNDLISVLIREIQSLRRRVSALEERSREG